MKAETEKELFNIEPNKTIYFIDTTEHSYKKREYEIIPYSEQVKNIKYVIYGDRYRKIIFDIYKISRIMVVESENYPIILNMPCIPLQNCYWAGNYDEIALLQYEDHPTALNKIFFGNGDPITPNWVLGGE